MINLIYIFFGHLIGEGLFSKQLTHAKREKLFFLGIHSAVYAVVVMIFIYAFISRDFVFLKFGLLFGSHFLIDYWKCYIVKVEAIVNVGNLRYSLLDQMLHLLVLAYTIYL